METFEEENAPEEATISPSEDAKEAEKGMETADLPEDKPAFGDVTQNPDYIRIATERDVYKEMYMNLLQMKAAM